MDQTSFTVCALILTGAIAALIATIFVDQKSKIKVKEAEDAKMLAEERLTKANKQITSLEVDIDTLIGRQIKGYPVKFFIAFTFDENNCQDGVTVCADYQTKDCIQTVVLKHFPYGDDDKFAILEAHELIDHLNEK